jgi:plastocyanin domain-containing protein
MRIFRKGAKAWAAVVFAVLGCAAIASCDKKADASHESPSASMLLSATGQARVVADEHGFTPSSLALQAGGAGSKATITFVRTTDKTCATEVVFPELKITKPLPLNEAVAIDVPTDSARTLTFQCGMGMFKGALLVK